MITQILTNAGIVALLSLLVALLPLGVGLSYAIHPTEQRLALMRPVSLAAIFGALGGLLSGLVSILRLIGVSDTPVDLRIPAIGLSEALVPLFVAFACLTVGWLCAAVGLRRHP
ncbi:MAG: hypothetical protein QM736_13030 [Vicinamibacterales bacterium]